MFKYLLTILLIITFTACAKQPIKYTTKVYIGVNKNAVLNAAKRVLKISDSDFRVYSKRNIVEASKTNIIYKGFTPDISVSHIIIETRYEEERTKTKLIIKKNKNYNDEKPIFASQNEYDFFWKRMDYILGLNETWESCYQNMFNNEAILCDFIYNQNNNALKSDIIQDTSIFVQKEIADDNHSSITNVDLSVLDNIKLPFKNTQEESPFVEKPRTLQENTDGQDVEIEVEVEVE